MEESDNDTEDTYENICDWTASDITILKTSHEANQIFKVLGLQFQFFLPPAAAEECPLTASSSMCEISISDWNVSTTTFNDSLISAESE